MLKILDMKVPSDFRSFLKNGDNKTMMNIIEQATIEDKIKLGTRIIFFSNKDHCRRICEFLAVDEFSATPVACYFLKKNP